MGTITKIQTPDGTVHDIREVDLENAIAIIANGNTHVSVTAGQFIYIKNHATLSEGLYTAKTNINANAALTSSNVMADDQGGGLNAIHNRIAKHTFSVQSYTDLSTYNASDKRYTIPSDGYVRVISGSSLGNAAVGYISDYIRITAKTQVNGYLEYNALFVRAGMNVYVALSGDSTAAFFPLS